MDNVKGGGENLNGINSIAGRRNRCYLRNSEYHLLKKRPQRFRLRTGMVPAASFPKVSTRPTNPPISLEPRAEQPCKLSPRQETEEPREKSFSAYLELLGSFSAEETESGSIHAVRSSQFLLE